MATNLQLVKEVSVQEASGGSFTPFSITDCFNANYDTYYVTINNIDGNLAGYYIWLRFIDSSGSLITGSEYAWSCHLMRSNSGFSSQRSANTTLINMVGFSGSGSATDDRYDTGTSFFVYKPFDATYMTMVTAEFGGSYNTPEHWGGQTIGVHKQQEQVTGMAFGGHSAFYFAKIQVFGVKK
tara:strand:+ start:258 stop:803 length:546 start_codon:yes stop_codon:yes gene_type:complete